MESSTYPERPIFLVDDEPGILRGYRISLERGGINNTVEISEKVEFNMIKPASDLIPNFDLPEGFDKEEEYLKTHVTDGMTEKCLIDNDKYRKRAQDEMSFITKCN